MKYDGYLASWKVTYDLWYEPYNIAILVFYNKLFL